MATVLVRILDRLDEVVRAAVPAGTTVWRDRADALSLDEAPAVNVLARDGSIEAHADDWDRHEDYVEIRIQVRAEVGMPAADAIHEAIHAAMQQDGPLALLAEGRRLTDYSVDRAEADTTRLVKAARYRFTYTVPRHQL